MKTLSAIIAVCGLTLASSANAGPKLDCALEGVVTKTGASDNVAVVFRSAKQYQRGATCSKRHLARKSLKLPVDVQLEGAAQGTPVTYRYRSDSNGERMELVAINGAQVAAVAQAEF